MIVGDKIKELRKEKGLTQKELAQIIDFSQSRICDWEKGDCEPSAIAIIALANFFEVSADYLLGREDDFGNITMTAGDITGNNNTVNSHNIIGTPAKPLSPSDTELIKKYHAASPELRKAIDKLLS